MGNKINLLQETAVTGKEKLAVNTDLGQLRSVSIDQIVGYAKNSIRSGGGGTNKTIGNASQAATSVASTTQEDYIYASQSTIEVDVNAGDVIPFDTVEKSRGITLTANEFRLSAGKSYECVADFRITNAVGVGTFVQIFWRDVTNEANIGRNAILRPLNATANLSSLSTARAVIEPSTDIDVALRVEATNVANDADVGLGWAIIKEIT